MNVYLGKDKPQVDSSDFLHFELLGTMFKKKYKKTNFPLESCNFPSLFEFNVTSRLNSPLQTGIGLSETISRLLWYTGDFLGRTGTNGIVGVSNETSSEESFGNYYV